MSEIVDNFSYNLSNLFFLSIDTNRVIEEVKTLFVDHPHLIQGFNDFLPPTLKIPGKDQDDNSQSSSAPQTRQRSAQKSQSGEDESDRQKDLAKAKEYVRKIKKRFESTPDTYKSFLSILQDFSREKITTQEIYDKVSNLFQDHSDLLDDFSHFLPESATNNEMPLSQTQVRTRPVRTRAAVPTTPPSTETMVRHQPKRQKRYRAEADGSHGTFEELQNIFLIKRSLPKPVFHQFLKCVSLHNSDIINKDDLFYFVNTLMEPHTDPDLIKWFADFVKVDPEACIEKKLKEKEEFQSLENDSLGNSKFNNIHYDDLETIMVMPNKEIRELLEDYTERLSELNKAVKSIQETISFLREIVNVLNAQEGGEIGDKNLPESSKNIIHQLYGYRADDLIKMFIENPLFVSFILGTRLLDKWEELQQARKAMKQFCDDVEDGLKKKLENEPEEVKNEAVEEEKKEDDKMEEEVEGIKEESAPQPKEAKDPSNDMDIKNESNVNIQEKTPAELSKEVDSTLR